MHNRDEGDSDYMQLLFGSPQDGSTTARGGPAFTPRGTLVALSEVNGNKGAAISLGKPLTKHSGVNEDTPPGFEPTMTVNMEYATEWINKVFASAETPRGVDAIHQQRSDAFKWLHENFGGIQKV